MAQPVITSPKKTSGWKSWEGWNANGGDASFGTLTKSFVVEHKPLPAGVLSAIKLFPRSQYSPSGDHGAVRWKVAKVVGTSVDDGQGNTTAGLALEGGLTSFTGGATSGNNCSEHGLWDSAAQFFDRNKAVYVLRVNLAPCLRCCQSLIGIAKDRDSPIVVIPDVDYEILASSRTPVTDGSYAFVFEATRGAFTVIHDTQTPRTFGKNLGPRGQVLLCCIACKTRTSANGVTAGQQAPCHSPICKGASKVLIDVPWLDGASMW